MTTVNSVHGNAFVSVYVSAHALVHFHRLWPPAVKYACFLSNEGCSKLQTARRGAELPVGTVRDTTPKLPGYRISSSSSRPRIVTAPNA